MRRSIAGLVLACIAALTPAPALATYPRDKSIYVVPLGRDPDTPAEAASGLATRKAKVIDAAACDEDLAFWSHTWSKNPRDRNEGDDSVVIGKAGVLLRNADDFRAGRDPVVCDRLLTRNLYDLNMPESPALAGELLGAIGGLDDLSLQVGWINESLLGFSKRVEAAVRANYARTFGDDCRDAIKSVSVQAIDLPALQRALDGKLEERGSQIQVQVLFQETLKCLKAQINVALMNRQVQGRVGSSGLPCPFDGSGEGEGSPDPDRSKLQTDGEWDVQMRDLIRILYLNERSAVPRLGAAPWLLDAGTIRHVREDLILLNTYPGEESYSVLQCGNQEDAHGDALDRLEQRDWGQKALDSLGDLLLWLWHRAALIAIALGAGAAALALFPYFAPVVVPAVAAVILGGSTARTPETENHLLMIETTRYLHNQLLLRDLARDHPDEDRSSIEGDQGAVRAWLMDRLRTIFHDDFSEYNARPYQRYSLIALINLSEFADDTRVRDAARMVLTTTAAKAAIATNEGVRFVPFRRRLEAVNAQYFCGQYADGIHCPNVSDVGEYADHFIALWQLWSGQTPQHEGRITLDAAKDLVSAATSSYAPPQPIVALAIPDAQSQARWQILNHDEIPEVSYSERAFLVSGGGIEAGPANQLEFSVLGVPLKTVHARSDDGAGVPTTLQFRRRAGASGSPEPDNGALSNLIRIYGYPDFDKDHVWTTSVMPLQVKDALPMFDKNLCVYRSFACGVNLSLPADFVGCLVNDPLIPGLSYLDTEACGAIKNVEHTYVVIWRAPCDSDASGNGCRNMGFFEAFAASTLGANGRPLAFAEFTQRVRARNAAKSGVGFACHDTYVTARGAGDSIRYHCDDKYAIRAVNGVDLKKYTDEDPAKGNVIVRTGDGYVHTIWWPEANTYVQLDWSDPDNPVHP